VHYIFGETMSSRNFSFFADIPFSIIREISETVAQINRQITNEQNKVIDLSLGQNFLGDPSIIFEKVKFLNKKDGVKPILYEPSLGPIDTRRSIAENFYPYFYSDVKGVLDEENIMITDGAFGAVRNALGAIFRPGDIFVIDRITFRYFVHALVVLGRMYPNIHPYIIQSEANTGFVPSPDKTIEFLEELRLRYPTKNIVYYTQFGFNPTGCFRTSKDLKEIVSYIENEKNLFLINDIAYHLVRWSGKDTPLASALADEGNGIVDAESLSKPFGLMGARVGALITRDKELFKYAARIQQYTIVSPTKLAVDVWRIISDPDNLPEIEKHIKNTIEKIRENFHYFVKEAEKFELKTCNNVIGTIYAFLEVPYEASRFWKVLLEKAKVAVVPGTAFTDPRDKIGEKYVRITISVKKEMLEKSIQRIENFFRKEL